MCSLSFCWCNEHLTIFNWTFAHQKIKERDFLNLDWMVGISLVEGKAVYTLFYALFCLKMQIRLGLGELHFFFGGTFQLLIILGIVRIVFSFLIHWNYTSGCYCSNVRELIVSCILAYSQCCLLLILLFSTSFLIDCKDVFSIIVFLFELL